jgi:hypothetical protein
MDNKVSKTGTPFIAMMLKSTRTKEFKGKKDIYTFSTWLSFWGKQMEKVKDAKNGDLVRIVGEFETKMTEKNGSKIYNLTINVKEFTPIMSQVEVAKSDLDDLPF